jgi:hypothetical protein
VIENKLKIFVYIRDEVTGKELHNVELYNLYFYLILDVKQTWKK